MQRVLEPIRKSLLDIVQENLRAAGQSVYVTRVTYCGEYTGTSGDFENKMTTIIEDLQMDYQNAAITGLLLVYPEYYVHMLEASEDIIYRHFKAIHEDEGGECKFGRAIFLPTYHHVYQRFFLKWFHICTTPPTLLEKLEGQTLSDIQKQVSNCFSKMYALCHYVGLITRESTITVKDILHQLAARVTLYLPENTLLAFLLNVKSPVLETIEDYVKLHSAVPRINLYKDSVWPPPRDVMLRNALDKCVLVGSPAGNGGQEDCDEHRHKRST